MAKTFAQLSVQPTVTPHEVAASFREYVATGSVIYYPLVCRIMDAANLCDVQKRALAMCAMLGVRKQREMGDVRAAFDYLAVHAHLNRDATA